MILQLAVSLLWLSAPDLPYWFLYLLRIYTFYKLYLYVFITQVRKNKKSRNDSV